MNSCWLSSFLFLSFQPQTCDTCWPFYSAIQRFLLVKISLVLAAWINLKLAHLYNTSFSITSLSYFSYSLFYTTNYIQNFLTAQLVRPRKFFFLSHLFHTSTIVVHLSSTFSFDISLFDTQSLHLSTLHTVINFNVATNFYLKLIRVAMVLTAFINVIPVSHTSWF